MDSRILWPDATDFISRCSLRSFDTERSGERSGVESRSLRRIVVFVFHLFSLLDVSRGGLGLELRPEVFERPDVRIRSSTKEDTR